MALVTVSRWACAEEAPPSIELTWDAPTSVCPTPAAVVERVSAELSQVSADGTRGMSAIARVSTTAHNTLRLELRTTSAQGTVGERSIESATCAELVDATVLVLGIAARSAAESAAESAELAVAPSSPPKANLGGRPSPGEDPFAPDPAGKRPPPRRRLAFTTLRASGALSLGALPSLSPGATLAFGLVIRSFQVELEVGAWLPQQSDTSAAGSVSVGLANAALRSCFRPSEHRWQPAACGAFVAGDMYGHGTELTNAKSGSGFWAALLFGLWSGARIADGWSARAGLEAGPMLAGPTFVFDREGRAFRARAYEARASLGVEFEWR